MVTDGVDCSSQKMVERRPQRKSGRVNSRAGVPSCGILDSVLFWRLLDKIPAGKLTKGGSTQESFLILRKKILKVGKKLSCGVTVRILSEDSEFKRKVGAHIRWEQAPAKSVCILCSETLGKIRKDSQPH